MSFPREFAAIRAEPMTVKGNGAARTLGAFAVSGEGTMQGTENAAALLGRVAMSLLFILAGWGKLLAPAATQAMLASHHLPMVKFGWIPPWSSNWAAD